MQETDKTPAEVSVLMAGDKSVCSTAIRKVGLFGEQCDGIVLFERRIIVGIRICELCETKPREKRLV
jgi:hypothetical protein